MVFGRVEHNFREIYEREVVEIKGVEKELGESLRPLPSSTTPTAYCTLLHTDPIERGFSFFNSCISYFLSHIAIASHIHTYLQPGG